MKTEFATPVGLGRTVLAVAVALVLASPVYATVPEPPTGLAVADRAAVSDAKLADNSAYNARDVAGDDLTPLDQSDAEADVEITRSIRKMLVDDASLGTNAQNVKVITAGGMVTLRGAVATADEQARIVAIAKGAAGVDRVVNELQVIKR
jgi:osmotically-inducible protein OsmY